MKPSFKISAISLAVLGSFSFVSNANAGNTDYSNQTTAGVISVIGAGNSISGDNLKVDSAGYQSNSQRNEGVYIGDGSSASFGGDYFEVKFKETDSTREFAGVQVNTQGQDTTAIFNSTSTVIDVEGPGASSKWGFGLLVNGINGKASAKFTGGDVLIRATTENYTSQTLTVKENSEIIFDNTGDVTVESFSPFGVTVVDAYGNITFNNEGNVLLKGEIIPGDNTAQTNVVGIQGQNTSWVISDKVKKFEINLSGAGVDNDGTSYSTGTKGISASGSDMKVSVNSKEFVINMNVATDVEDDSPTGHTSEKAQGIYLAANAEMNIGSGTKTTISVYDGLGTARGVELNNGGKINFGGDTSISATGKTQSYAIKIDGYGTPTYVTLGGQTNSIKGDISVNSSSGASLNLKNGTTTLDGNIDVDEGSSLVLEGSTLQLVQDNQVNVLGQVSSTNGKLILNEAKQDIVNISKITEGSNLQAIASSSLNDKLSSDINLFSQSLNIDEGAETVSLLMQEGMVAGETIARLNEDGTVNQSSIIRKTNTLMQSALEMASIAPLTMARILSNDVRKRLGDIRSDNLSKGVWARYDGGSLSSNHGLDTDFNTVQVGFDTTLFDQMSRLGVAFSYTKGDTDYMRGSADLEAYSLAGYGTWMSNFGTYLDLIGRVATVNNDMKVDGHLKGSMDSLVLGLSAETGCIFNVFDMAFVEPQIEATYTYVDGDQFNIGSAEYDVDSVDSLVGRLGFVAGVNCPSDFGQAYIRASAVHEFLGDTKIRGSSEGSYGTYSQEGRDTWFEYAVGANFTVNKNVYLWADVERTEGSKIEEDWRATAGIRYFW